MARWSYSFLSVFRSSCTICLSFKLYGILQIRRGVGPLTTVKKVGPDLSKKMYTFFMSFDGKATLSQEWHTYCYLCECYKIHMTNVACSTFCTYSDVKLVPVVFQYKFSVCMCWFPLINMQWKDYTFFSYFSSVHYLWIHFSLLMSSYHY